MKNVSEIHVRENSGEEMLDGMAPDFPYISTRALLDRYSVLWHWHKAVELFYMESGSLEYETPQGKHIFPTGSGGLVNTGVLHRTCPLSSDAPTIQKLHIFDAALLYSDVGGRIYQKYFAPILTDGGVEIIPLLPDDSKQAKLLELLRDSFSLDENEPGYELRLRTILSDIWLGLAELNHSTVGSSKLPDEKIKLMMLYIHENYPYSVKISDIAAAGFVSERECYRAFQATLHTSPGEYLRMYRLQIACKMLRETDKSITYISQSCGFGSSSFFGKAFLAHFGTTPTEYRRSCSIS